MPQEKKEEEPVKDTNGEKNGEIKEDIKDAEPSGATQKLSLGEIAVVEGEIAKAKIDQLQPLHNVSRVCSC
jgi:hypothetical protein